MPSEISPSLFTKWPAFKILKNRPELFAGTEIYPGGYGIIRNDQPDLSCDELYEKRSAGAVIRSAARITVRNSPPLVCGVEPHYAAGLYPVMLPYSPA